MSQGFEASQYQNPYQQPTGELKPAPPRNKSRWVLFFAGGMGCAVVFLCCGGVGFLAMLGFGMVEDEIEEQLRDHPVVVEHIGDIQTFKMDFMASMSHGDDETYVYDITGTKGSGVATVKSLSPADGPEEIINASLRLSTGKEFELIP